MISRRKKRQTNPKVQLTALVDAFTILLVFFMLQFSVEPELIKPDEKVTLPISKNGYATPETKNINVIINKDHIKVNGVELLSLSSGLLASSSLHTEDSEFIMSLHNTLEGDEGLKESKEHQWIILADEKVPYETIKKTIYTLAVSGFTKIKLASSGELH